MGKYTGICWLGPQFRKAAEIIHWVKWSRSLGISSAAAALPELNPSQLQSWYSFICSPAENGVN